MNNRKRNLYKLDDVCLFLSVLFFIVLIIQFRSLIPYLNGSDFSILLDEALFIIKFLPLRLGIILFSALFFQIIGRVVRKKEKISLEIIDAISHRSRVSTANLSAEIGRDLVQIEKVAKQLAKLPGAGVSFDGNYLKIDREEPVQPVHRHETNTAPQEAAEPFRQTIPEPLKNIFDKNLSKEELRDKFQEIVAEKKAAGSTASIRPPSGRNDAIRPNVPLLIFLFIAFWPAAVVYVISFYMKNMQAKALNDGINKK